MKCLLAEPDHCLSLALLFTASKRSDIVYEGCPLSECGDYVEAHKPDAVIVPPLARLSMQPPEAIYRYCDAVDALIDRCKQNEVALLWCVSDSLYEDGAYWPIDEDMKPEPVQEPLKRLMVTGYKLRQLPGHILLRLGPLFMIDGQDAWLGPLVNKLINGESIEGPQDMIICPTSGIAAAKAINGILLQLHSGAKAWGVYHLAGTEPVSVHSFYSVIRAQVASQLEEAGVSCELGEALAQQQQREAPLRRVLNCRRLLDVFGIQQKSWRVELGQMLSFWCQREYGKQDSAKS